MAREKTTTARATTKKPATRKSTSTKKKPATKTPTARGRAKTTETKPKATRATPNTRDRDLSELQYLVDHINLLMNNFLQNHESDAVLTGPERRRLMGAGVRNYGFIEKSLDVARENPDILPANFNVWQFATNVQTLDAYRQLFWVLEKFTQAVNEAVLISANASMRDALRVYNILKEMTHSRVRGAEPLFRALNRFFERPRHPEQGEEPTIPELERDFNKIVHGKADGEIIAKNISPRVSGGKREIIDETFKDSASFKETDEGSINE